MGEAFGAEVIKINGSAGGTAACGAGPQADSMNIKIKSRMNEGRDDFMR